VIVDFVRGLGAWAWIIGGVILLALEIAAPGNVFMWFGVAAVLTGVLSLFTDLGWQIDLIVFGGLSLILVIVGRRYFARRSESADPLLNRRAESLVGRVYVLSEPIVGGIGRVRVNDANWRINGPDLPSGTPIKVVGHDGAVLTVARAES
jgi:inner membrane protein